MTDILKHHFYGRRRNRGLHQQRQSALDRVEERFFIAPLPGETTVDPQNFFGDTLTTDMRLEIGFGYGEHLVHQAELNPAAHFLGIEPFITGIAIAALTITDKELENIRIYPDDAMHLLPRFPNHSFSHIYLFFPDPWPKARHYKRRFIQTKTVALLARLLQPTGVLHIATDIPELADWMTGHILANSVFDWTPQRAIDRITPPADWVTTKYQQKAIAESRNSVYLDFMKR